MAAVALAKVLAHAPQCPRVGDRKLLICQWGHLDGDVLGRYNGGVAWQVDIVIEGHCEVQQRGIIIRGESVGPPQGPPVSRDLPLAILGRRPSASDGAPD